MEKKVKMLSLGQWPTRPHNYTKTQLSPITKRILGQVQIDPKNILPLTFQNFLQNYEHSSDNKEQLDEYRFEVERRKKKVSILGEIRTSYILGKQYGVSNKKKKENRSRMKPRSRSKEYESQLQLQSVRSKSKISRQMSRTRSNHHGSPGQFKDPKSSRKMQKSPGSKREESDYFVHFDPRKNPVHRKHSQIQEDQSTQSHQNCKPKVRSGNHQQYGLLGTGRYSKIQQRKASISGKIMDNSRQLCQQLVKTVEAWEQLDQRHLREVTKMGGMSGRERQRLQKMHSMEKQAMGARVKGIKSRLRSEGQI